MEIISFNEFLKKYITENQKSQEEFEELSQTEFEELSQTDQEIIETDLEGVELSQEEIIEYDYDELDEEILNDLRKYNITKEVFYANNLKVLQIKSRKFLYEFCDEEFVNENYEELTKIKFLCFKNRLKLYPPFGKFSYFANKKDLSTLYIPLMLYKTFYKDTLYIAKSELEAIYFNTLNKQSVALINFICREKDFENLINFISERNIKKICIVFDREIDTEIDREKREKLYKNLCNLAIKLLLMNFDVKVYYKNKELEFIDVVYDKQDVLSFLKKIKSDNVVKEIEIVNKLAKKFNVSLNSLLQDLYKYTDDEIKNKILSISQSREKELLDVVDMLSSSDLIKTVEQDLKNLYVDVKQAMLFYFILLSRKVRNLNRNFIVTLQGQSKLFFVTNLLKLIDEDDVIQISHLSKKALYYTDETLNHKLIFLSEIKEEVSDVIKKIIFDKKLVIRSLSESNLIKKEKDCNSTPIVCYALHSKELQDVSINFDLNCNVSDIVKLKANQSKIESIQSKYRIVDVLLKSYEVVIDEDVLKKFAKSFTNLIEFERFEDLVKASALLHQYQRRKVNDKLIANYKDYEIAMFLLLSESKKHHEIDKDVEVVLRAIKFLQNKKQRNITRKELVKFLSKKLNKTERTIANYLKKAKAYKVIIIEGRGRGGAIVKIK